MRVARNPQHAAGGCARATKDRLLLHDEHVQPGLGCSECSREGTRPAAHYKNIALSNGFLHGYLESGGINAGQSIQPTLVKRRNH
ncbi:hypothetical protein D3C76_1704240 [compost metagenome]